MKNSRIFDVLETATGRIYRASLVTDELPDLDFDQQGTKLEGDKWYLITPEFLLLKETVGKSIWIEIARGNVTIMPLDIIVTERFEVLDDDGTSLGSLADVLGE